MKKKNTLQISLYCLYGPFNRIAFHNRDRHGPRPPSNGYGMIGPAARRLGNLHPSPLPLRIRLPSGPEPFISSAGPGFLAGAKYASICILLAVASSNFIQVVYYFLLLNLILLSHERPFFLKKESTLSHGMLLKLASSAVGHGIMSHSSCLSSTPRRK